MRVCWGLQVCMARLSDGGGSGCGPTIYKGSEQLRTGCARRLTCNPRRLNNPSAPSSAMGPATRARTAEAPASPGSSREVAEPPVRRFRSFRLPMLAHELLRVRIRTTPYRVRAQTHLQSQTPQQPVGALLRNGIRVSGIVGSGHQRALELGGGHADRHQERWARMRVCWGLQVCMARPTTPPRSCKPSCTSQAILLLPINSI
jgi:hypothetical protein